MPALPDVEGFRSVLAEHGAGRRVERVEVADAGAACCRAGRAIVTAGSAAATGDGVIAGRLLPSSALGDRKAVS